MSDFFRKLVFLPPQGSTFAIRSDALHLWILLATMVVATGIGIVGLVFLLRYRGRGDAARTPHIEAPLWLEGIFISVPLALFLFWGAWGFHDFVWVSRAPVGAMDVYVTGKQWMWKFSLPGGPDAIDVLHVPANRPVRLLITSRDVVHSFFVPDFRLKRDAVPGRYTEIWFEATEPGRHEVLCAEYCGLDHSLMRAEIVVLAPDAFEAWRARQLEVAPAVSSDASRSQGHVEPASASSGMSMVERGEHVAARVGCFKCHSVDGSPHIGPTWLGLYRRVEPLTGGGTVIADEAYLTESMMQPRLKVVAGFAPVMPTFLGALSPGDVGALVEFIKSLSVPHPEAPGAEEPVYAPVER